MKSKTVKKCLSAILILGIVVAGGDGGRRWYRALRQRRLVKQARQFLVASDPKNALLCLQSALVHNPRDADACRLMADVAEARHSPSALIWRSRVVEYNPSSLADRLALAESAIQRRDFATATSALDGVRAADKNQPAFHNIAGNLAASVNQPEIADAHFREASRLEPSNIVPLLNLAVLHLRGSNTTAALESRTFLRKLGSNPTNAAVRWNALHELTLDAMRHRDTNGALALSQELLQQTNSIFADQIIRLDVLSDTGNVEFKPALAAVERVAAGDPAKVAELAAWETHRIPVAEVLTRLRGLPKETQTNQAVALVMAECYADSRDWRGLGGFLDPQSWGETDFIRHGFLARAWRGQEMIDTAKIEWDAAVKTAHGSRLRLMMLLGLASQWDWKGEKEGLLREIIDKYPNDQAAFQALAQTLFLEGQTRSLLQLYTQTAKRDPANLDARNNEAFIALLLSAQDLKPHDLAWEVYQKSPTNSAFAITYALSLLLQKKNVEALKIIESLDPRELDHPSAAGFYGLALRANGHPEKARKYLELAAKARMLPEQRKLLTTGSL